jgi:hydrogenase expression/formation protein HypC
MCLAVPARVISIEGAFAVVDMMGFQSSAYIDFIESASVGDYVLIHAGCAIERIDEEAFDCYNTLCKELSEV